MIIALPLTLLTQFYFYASFITPLDYDAPSHEETAAYSSWLKILQEGRPFPHLPWPFGTPQWLQESWSGPSSDNLEDFAQSAFLGNKLFMSCLGK
jgi:hypothetical protein